MLSRSATWTKQNHQRSRDVFGSSPFDVRGTRRPLPSPYLEIVTLAGVVDDAERRIEEERARIEAEYREVLKSSVAFEKRIRDRWREKNRQKNARIAELEARVAELEQKLKTQRLDPE